MMQCAKLFGCKSLTFVAKQLLDETFHAWSMAYRACFRFELGVVLPLRVNGHTDRCVPHRAESWATDATFGALVSE